MSEEVEKCERCGRPVDSFGCKIRHLTLDHSWAKGDH